MNDNTEQSAIGRVIEAARASAAWETVIEDCHGVDVAFLQAVVLPGIVRATLRAALAEAINEGRSYGGSAEVLDELRHLFGL